MENYSNTSTQGLVEEITSANRFINASIKLRGHASPTVLQLQEEVTLMLAELATR